MGLRDSINQNPAITTGATIAVILVALGFILWNTFAPDGSNSAGPGIDASASTQATKVIIQP